MHNKRVQMLQRIFFTYKTNAIPNFFRPGIEETLKFSLEHSTVSTEHTTTHFSHSVTRAVGRCVWDGRDENCGTAKLSRE